MVGRHSGTYTLPCLDLLPCPGRFDPPCCAALWSALVWATWLGSAGWWYITLRNCLQLPTCFSTLRFRSPSCHLVNLPLLHRQLPPL